MGKLEEFEQELREILDRNGRILKRGENEYIILEQERAPDNTIRSQVIILFQDFVNSFRPVIEEGRTLAKDLIDYSKKNDFGFESALEDWNHQGILP